MTIGHVGDGFGNAVENCHIAGHTEKKLKESVLMPVKVWTKCTTARTLVLL